MKRVRVTWQDSYVVASWTSFEDLKTMLPPVITSEGLLFNEDSTVIRLVGMWEENVGNAIQIIPKGCILEMEDVNDCSCTVTKEGRDTMAVEEQV